MRRIVLLIASALGVVLFSAAGPAVAAPTTEVVQGQVLRLVSVADWAAAGALVPGESVKWDVSVSADAPDPGTVTIGVSATGDAPLTLDVATCDQEWQADGCPSAATSLRESWEIPRNGAEIALARMSDTEVAHLRLTLMLADDSAQGSTDVRVHASGEGEALVIGPDGDLATTGLPRIVPGLLAAGAVLLVLGAVFLVVRRRDARDSAAESALDPTTGARP